MSTVLFHLSGLHLSGRSLIRTVLVSNKFMSTTFGTVNLSPGFHTISTTKLIVWRQSIVNKISFRKFRFIKRQTPFRCFLENWFAPMQFESSSEMEVAGLALRLQLSPSLSFITFWEYGTLSFSWKFLFSSLQEKKMQWCVCFS